MLLYLVVKEGKKVREGGMRCPHVGGKDSLEVVEAASHVKYLPLGGEVVHGGQIRAPPVCLPNGRACASGDPRRVGEAAEWLQGTCVVGGGKDKPLPKAAQGSGDRRAGVGVGGGVVGKTD